MIEYRVAAIARFRPAAVFPVGFSMTTTVQDRQDDRDFSLR